MVLCHWFKVNSGQAFCWDMQETCRQLSFSVDKLFLDDGEELLRSSCEISLHVGLHVFTVVVASRSVQLLVLNFSGKK